MSLFCAYFLFSARASFVRDYLGAPAGIDIDELKAQNETFKKQLEAKDAEIAELKKQVLHSVLISVVFHCFCQVFSH
jgi:hypothetical protein